MCSSQQYSLVKYFNTGYDAGTRSDDDDVVHESVSGYYDNNNQYRYRVREHVEHPDVHVGVGTRASSSATRRPLSSHRHRYHHAAELGDMDMSYEVMDHSFILCTCGFV